MKKITIIFAAATFLFVSCNNTSTEKTTPIQDSTKGVFGKNFENKKPTAAAEVVTQIRSGKEFKGVMEGRITEVCQMSGCWANVELPSGEKLKIKFRDANGEEFGIDKNAKDKIIDVYGVGYMDTISVEMLKHYAEDDKQSKEEIAKINKPEITPSFTASGAMLKQ